MQQVPRNSNPFQQATTPSLLAIADEANLYSREIQSLTSNVPAPAQAAARGLARAIDDASASHKALAQALAAAAKILSDPSLARQYKITNATKGIQGAQKDAEGALDAAISASETARKALEKALLPQAPAADSAMLAFTAGQLADLVKKRAANHPEMLPVIVGDLVGDALSRNAQDEVYLLRTALWPTYNALALSPETGGAIRQAIANAYSAAKGEGVEAKGTALLVELGDGGAFVRWIACQKYLITWTTGPALEHIGYLANNGQIQNWG